MLAHGDAAVALRHGRVRGACTTGGCACALAVAVPKRARKSETAPAPWKPVLSLFFHALRLLFSQFDEQPRHWFSVPVSLQHQYQAVEKARLLVELHLAPPLVPTLFAG